MKNESNRFRDVERKFWVFGFLLLLVQNTYPVILPDNAVIEPAKRLAFDCVNVNALLCDEAPR